MLNLEQVARIKQAGRTIATAKAGDKDLGPFELLPGKWRSLPGRGWNMIALPFAQGRFKYRLLMNQYNETLTFNLVDKGVPNRGISDDGSTETDQFVVALDYEQNIIQLAAEDFPVSGEAGDPGLAIHHEPGLFLHQTNEVTDGLDIARLATVPHGDSVLGLGHATTTAGAPSIPNISGLPIGVPSDLNSPYLEPYKHFHETPFRGLFDPVEPNRLLEEANQGITIENTTALSFDTTLQQAGIVNIPFVVRQANAAEMKSTFWIEELASEDDEPALRLQYSQIVLLDFFPRRDGFPGLIRWPHVSINTLEKVDD